MESAPQSWQEWLRIHDLYNRYFAALDNGPDEQWVGCFTQDGVLETPTLGVLGAGHAALAAWIKSYHESWKKDEQRRHMLTNLCVDIDGDKATGSCYLTAYHCRAGKGEPRSGWLLSRPAGQGRRRLEVFLSAGSGGRPGLVRKHFGAELRNTAGSV
jgi:hypothetical protein